MKYPRENFSGWKINKIGKNVANDESLILSMSQYLVNRMLVFFEILCILCRKKIWKEESGLYYWSINGMALFKKRVKNTLASGGK